MDIKDVFSMRRWSVYGWACLLACLLASCLDDGEETIALEPGDENELVLGTWLVEGVEMYDVDTHDYLSDVPVHAMRHAILNFQTEGLGVMTMNGEEGDMTWSLPELDNSVLNVNGTYYTLVSLGEGKMVLEMSYTSPDNEPVILRLVLVRTGSQQEAEEDILLEQTTLISSSQKGEIGMDGFRLTVPYGAVPQNSSGQDGQVAFSISKSDHLPAGLPQGMTPVSGNGYRMEPMNFVFNSPLTLQVPLPQGIDPSRLGLLRYNDYTGEWDEIPFSSIDRGSQTATASVLELGEFILVEKPAANTGGLRIPADCLEPGYYYYLTLTPVNGGSEVERIGFTANGQDLYMANIPMGTYLCQLTREYRGSLDLPSQGVETSLWEGYVTISNVLQPGNGGFDTYGGWVELTDFVNADWTNGRPDSWGEVTVTYGTGMFQATLTWVNVNTSTTDYDLHLYGPDGMHVYYVNKNSGTFELDRDWTTPLGNAIENIYSISEQLVPGNYQVKVHHFSGTLGKRYNCRIIINGSVVKSTSGSISVNKEFDDIYSFTIE